MPNLMNTIKEYLKDQSVDYSIEDGQLYFTLANADFSHEFQISVDEEVGWIYLFSEYDEKIPKKKLPVVAEFLMRINNRFPIGHFQMDYDDAYVRYKSSNIVGDGLLATNMIDVIIGEGLTIMNAGHPGLVAILEDGKTAIDAFRIVDAELDK